MQAEKPNILVIDDEIGMREGCRRGLSSQGFRVTTAEHGADGLQKLRQEEFALILLDAMMPGMSGLELLTCIRQQNPDTICIMITGYATVDLAAQAMKQGAFDFLPKPFTLDELLTVVHRGIEEWERRRQQRAQQEREEDIRELERARSDLAKLDAVESRFMLVVAHELRNPAGVIKNYLQLIRSGYVDADDWDDTIAQLDRRADQLLAMLDDILELAHLKQRTAVSKLVAVPAADVLAEVTRRFQPIAQTKGLDLNVQVRARPTIVANPTHLCSLWTKLIENAIQYTSEGCVTISLDEQGGWLVTQVADTGIGISTDELTSIFQEFYRTPSARAAVELGTGLGLPIVNQILRIYNGSIQVDSEVGQGSVFTVKLPLNGPSALT